MQVVATKTFRPAVERDRTVTSGEVMEVDQNYGRELIRLGLAVANEPKAIEEHENKMLQDFQNKGLPTKSQTERDRSQGVVGPSDKSDTAQERSSGKVNVQKESK